MTTIQEIARDIEVTRSTIRTTLAALEQRATVDAIMRRVIGPAKSGTIEMSRAVGAAARANPLALGVTAVGLGWLILASRGQNDEAVPSARVRSAFPDRLDPSRPKVDPDDGFGMDDAASVRERVVDTSTGKLNQMKSRAGESLDQARSRVGETLETARTRARAASDQAKDRARTAAEKVSATADEALKATRETASVVGTRLHEGAAARFVREHPMAVGAAVVFGSAALALIVSRRATNGDGAYDARCSGEDTTADRYTETPAATAADTTDPTPVSMEERSTAFGDPHTSGVAEEVATPGEFPGSVRMTELDPESKASTRSVNDGSPDSEGGSAAGGKTAVHH